MALTLLENLAILITVIAVGLNAYAIVPLNSISGFISAALWMLIAFKWHRAPLFWMQVFFAVLYAGGFITWYLR